MKNKSKDTIFALSTPYGQSAITVTRVSGDGALKIAKKVVCSNTFVYYEMLH